jgi:glucose/arabinose dehydrogenase
MTLLYGTNLSFSQERQPIIEKEKSLVINKIVDNLDSSSSFEIIGKDILITQKDDGKVKLVRDSNLKKYPIIDINTFNHGIDNGLKSIASGSRNNITYVFMLFAESTSRDTSTLSTPGVDYKVYRYNWNSSGLELTNKTLILTLPVLNYVNIGGKMIVGPDNQLYISIGDLEREGKEQNFPRTEDSFFDLFTSNDIKSSAIIRVDFDGFPSRGNPFTEEGFQKYYAYGIRNSLGLAFDPVTNYLWDTEQGPGSMDEINMVKAGFNSGWKAIQGSSESACCSGGIKTSQNIFKLYKVKGSYYDEPKAVFENSTGLTGITFFDSYALGSKFANSMFVGDMLGNIYNFELIKNREGIANALSPAKDVFAEGFGSISDLKAGPDGNLYVLTYSNSSTFPFNPNSGSLYMIKSTNTPSKLSERNSISIEQIALIITFLIILAILVSLRFRDTFSKIGEKRIRKKK